MLVFGPFLMASPDAAYTLGLQFGIMDVKAATARMIQDHWYTVHMYTIVLNLQHYSQQQLFKFALSWHPEDCAAILILAGNLTYDLTDRLRYFRLAEYVLGHVVSI